MSAQISRTYFTRVQNYRYIIKTHAGKLLVKSLQHINFDNLHLTYERDTKFKQNTLHLEKTFREFEFLRLKRYNGIM